MSKDEQFVIETIQQKGKGGTEIAYKTLQDLCADKFEGVRLVLKKLKEKGIVDFEGSIPGFSATITLLRKK